MEKIKKIKELFNTALSSDKFWAAAILLAVWGAFAPSLNFKELIGDDFFYYNHLLTLEKNIWNIFDPVLGLRTPLTSLSLYADFLLWGKKGFVTGAHFINILLHCGTGILFYVQSGDLCASLGRNGGTDFCAPSAACGVRSLAL